nr:hypothetical protein Itr_chr14CG29460 [Ipomoea trifida]GME19867.1 hypothetical protein Iba_scaffold24011CG0010 [Ipomoea batatas]
MDAVIMPWLASMTDATSSMTFMPLRSSTWHSVGLISTGFTSPTPRIAAVPPKSFSPYFQSCFISCNVYTTSAAVSDIDLGKELPLFAGFLLEPSSPTLFWLESCRGLLVTDSQICHLLLQRNNSVRGVVSRLVVGLGRIRLDGQ